MINDELVSRIRKLLQLNTSANEFESSLALEKAKALAIRAGIDLASVTAFQGEKAEPIEKSGEINLGQRKSITQKFICWIIQNHFKCRLIYHGNRYYGYKLFLIGAKSDIEIASYVQSYLSSEFMRLWHKYRAEKACSLDYRSSFIYGLYQGLDEKLAAATARTEQESFGEIASNQGVEKSEEIKNNYSLMVVDHKKKLEDKVKELYPKLKKAQASNIRIDRTDAVSDGQAVGRTINLNRPIGYSNSSQISA